MYSGTRADEIPMPSPTRNLPMIMACIPCEVALFRKETTYKNELGNPDIFSGRAPEYL